MNDTGTEKYATEVAKAMVKKSPLAAELSDQQCATLAAIKVRLRKRMHRPLGETARWLRSVVQGWLQYHAVPGNTQRINRFVNEVIRLWLRVIRNRSQKGKQRWTWALRNVLMNLSSLTESSFIRRSGR